MAKIARRSVASNPSLLTTSSKFLLHNSNIYEEQQNNKRSSNPTSSNDTVFVTTNFPNLLSTESSSETISSSLNKNNNNTIDYHFTTQSNIPISNNSRQYLNGSDPTIINTVGSSNVGNINKNFNNNIKKNGNKTFFLENEKNLSLSDDNATTKIHNSRNEQFTNTTAIDLVAIERERMRTEFYATYDVMTGVRIAATLGGFFGLMVFLIVYKSRSHSNETLKVLKDPKTAALAVACMQEEEDRKIIEAMDATGLSIFPDEYDTMLFRRQRMLSLGNVSAPPVLNRGFRFSSIGGGGYSSLLEPTCRSSFSYGVPGSRRKSCSESSRILSNYPVGSSFGTDDYFVETDDELENNCNQRDGTILQNHGYLEVPPNGQDTRRSSAMTCCSTESSYLERRCSALTLGLNNLPNSLRQKLDVTNNQQRSRHGSTTDWDYYYPDIQVIQATPKTSPCPSERSLYDKPKYTTTRTISQDTTTTAGSGISSIAIDSGGSGYYYNGKNSMSANYDPESYQEKNLRSDEMISYYHHLDDSIENGDQQKREPYYSNKYNDHNETKLMVKRKMSDASSCTTTTINNININNNSLSYMFNNSNNNNNINSSITEIQTVGGLNGCQIQRGNSGICGTGIGRAPLASCSSFKMSSIEYQDSDLRSMGEDDSIFIESYADTDDDLEQFSTDSDEISLDNDDDEPLPTLAVESQRKINLINKIAPPLPIVSGSTSTTTNTAQHIAIKSDPISNDVNLSKKISIKSRCRPVIERHRTLSVSSSDRVQLVANTLNKNRITREKSKILETHFTCPPHHTNNNQQEELLLKPNLSNPLLAVKRNQLQQQYSDPVSLQTTTDEATTTTLETCSTEVPVFMTPDDIVKPNTTPIVLEISGGVTRKKPLKLKKTSSFSYDNNDSSISSSSNSNNKLNQKRFSNNSKIKNFRSHYSEGSCNYNKNKFDDENSVNPKKLIMDNKFKNNSNKIKNHIVTTKSPSVILELPIINLPTICNIASSSYQIDNDESEKGDLSRGTRSEGSVKDPSLPGTSRKWSKETLF